MMREVIDDFLAIAVGDEGALGARVASVGEKRCHWRTCPVEMGSKLGES